MKNNVIRQIIDIQAQAERLIGSKATMVEIEQFAKYNDEIKFYLLTNIEDSFVLNYVRDIPDLKVDEHGNKSGLLTFILVIMSTFFGSMALINERRKTQKFLDTIRDIKGKYASAEFMLRNYFTS